MHLLLGHAREQQLIAVGARHVEAERIARFGGSGARFELPKRTLTATGLFAGETVTFPFDELATPARQALSGCFK